MTNSKNYVEFKEAKVVLEHGARPVRARARIEWIQSPPPPEDQQPFKPSPPT